jgi:hypothetical protein
LQRDGCGTFSFRVSKVNVTGSIVTYKTDPDMLRRVIESFFRGSGNRAFEKKLYVIDNSPYNGIQEVLHSYKDWNIEYISTEKNLGY